jgi:hypothetical protein
MAICTVCPPQGFRDPLILLPDSSNQMIPRRRLSKYGVGELGSLGADTAAGKISLLYLCVPGQVACRTGRKLDRTLLKFVARRREPYNINSALSIKNFRSSTPVTRELAPAICGTRPYVASQRRDARSPRGSCVVHYD